MSIGVLHFIPRPEGVVEKVVSRRTQFVGTGLVPALTSYRTATRAVPTTPVPKSRGNKQSRLTYLVEDFKLGAGLIFWR